MSSWSDVVVAKPEFAATVRGYFDATPVKTIATLPQDGSRPYPGAQFFVTDHDGHRF